MFVPTNMPGKPGSASFTHNGPVNLGQSAEFTNASSGSPPLSYEWNFGDGVGTSTDENPTYDYSMTGTYTVTLTTTNAFGSGSYSLPIEVLPAKTQYFVYQPIIGKAP
jgi:PKD repeat protein